MSEDFVSQKQDSVLHGFEKSSSLFNTTFFIVLAGVILLGVGAGYLLTINSTSSKTMGEKTTSVGASLPKGTIEGSDDTKTFKDQAEGVLKKGGIEGEGQYHLVRPGGESQNVYLTSSIIDLSKYVDVKVRVWGQTNAAQKAGWLMDVGRIEVL